MDVLTAVKGTMRTRGLSKDVSARIAIGLLAAMYLWNLTIFSNKLFLQERAWNPTVVHTAPLHEATIDDTELQEKSSNENLLQDSVPDGMNVTLPPPEERVPAFIIIGAQKSATQALRSYLSQHPLVHFPTALVEPHFFDWGYRKEKSPKENLESYVKLLNGKHDYDCRQRNCITGESTPSYLFTTIRVPKRIKQLCPWAKFIVVLRDPVKRAFSQCNMLIEKHEVKTSFQEHYEFDREWMEQVGLVSNTSMTIEEENEAWNEYQRHRKVRKLILGRGMYEIQLRKWFEYFPREQFLILKSEELDYNRTATMRRVYEFLGLHHNVLNKDKKVHKKKYITTISNDTERRLYEFYRPYNKRLERLLGLEWKDIWRSPYT